MKRSDIRAFLESGVNNLANTMRFNSGRITEFNSDRSNEYPYAWLEPLVKQGNTWLVILHIAKKDKMDSSPKEYEAIVDECDFIAEQLLRKYQITFSTYPQLTIENDTRTPFIHKHADDTSGVILTFDLLDFSPSDVC